MLLTCGRPVGCFSRMRALTAFLLILLLVLCVTAFARAEAGNRASTDRTTRLKSTDLDLCLNVTGDPARCAELEYDEAKPEGIAVLWDVYNGTLTLQSSVVSIYGKCTVEQTGCGIDTECINEKWLDLAYSTTQSEWELMCKGNSNRVLTQRRFMYSEDGGNYYFGKIGAWATTLSRKCTSTDHMTVRSMLRRLPSTSHVAPTAMTHLGIWRHNQT